MIHTPINSGEMKSQRHYQNQRVFRTLQVQIGIDCFILGLSTLTIDLAHVGLSAISGGVATFHRPGRYAGY
ncbi:hypothetical protein HK23_12340 [Acetobacter malorum]|uniref:Uncharacterized protein n=1 Tax=Acetobacter malorum TaxID=178901 RepID=A0A1Y3G5I8_9PROT|nr:hypothetical protein HK23_12340 [Acetobacter malorum]